MICSILLAGQTQALYMYLPKRLTTQARVDLTGDNCNLANIKIEKSRLPGNLTVSVKIKIYIILSKQGISSTFSD